MLIRRGILAASFSLSVSVVCANEAASGIAVPVTISGGTLYTHRLKSADTQASPIAAAFRTMLYPTVKVGPNWFAYAAIQLRSTPYFYYDAYKSDRSLKVHLIQGFVGYAATRGKASIVAKAGRLASAFGSFPLRYDDAENPLLSQPLGYVSNLRLRPDQIPCGVKDLLHQDAYQGFVKHYCGGAEAVRNGMTPVTLYGLPGLQADVSAGRIDARVQLTNSSPVNPQSLLNSRQRLQWTAGSGITIQQGFRAGISAFRGAYLDGSLDGLLASGKKVPDYPATGIGADVQWARGRWSANGEFQRFDFESPRFRISPSILFGYLEVKSVITPRIYLAGRTSSMNYGRVEDLKGVSAARWAPRQHAYEFAAGYWLSRTQLLKVGYEWLNTQHVYGNRDNVFGVQFVTTIPNKLSKAFR